MLVGTLLQLSDVKLKSADGRRARAKQQFWDVVSTCFGCGVNKRLPNWSISVNVGCSKRTALIQPVDPCNVDALQPNVAARGEALNDVCHPAAIRRDCRLARAFDCPDITGRKPTVDVTGVINVVKPAKGFYFGFQPRMGQGGSQFSGSCGIRECATAGPGDGSGVITSPNADAYSNPDTYAYTDSNAYPDANPNTHSDAYTDAYSHPNADTDAYAYADTNAHTRAGAVSIIAAAAPVAGGGARRTAARRHELDLGQTRDPRIKNFEGLWLFLFHAGSPVGISAFSGAAF